MAMFAARKGASLSFLAIENAKEPYPNHKVNCKYEILEHIPVGLDFVIDEHFER